MELPANIRAAKRFVNAITCGEAPSTQNLLRHLDELALSYHDTPDGDPADVDEEPVFARVSMAEVAARFPGFGYYGLADPAQLSGEVLVGDAIDDLVDIVNDLKEVLWRFERLGSADAHWHFRFLYEIHWGEHLRDLARYLHSRLRIEAEQNY